MSLILSLFGLSQSTLPLQMRNYSTQHTLIKAGAPKIVANASDSAQQVALHQAKLPKLASVKSSWLRIGVETVITSQGKHSGVGKRCHQMSAPRTHPNAKSPRTPMIMGILLILIFKTQIFKSQKDWAGTMLR